MSVFKNEEKHPRAETIRDCDLVFFFKYIYFQICFVLCVAQSK